MKQTILTAIATIGLALGASAQLTPMASPLAKIEQKVGLTDITINYSRPGKKDREVFGNVVPFGEVWRTGANENTKFTTTDALAFGKDTLKAGLYAIYTIPSKDSWDVIFYNDATNWGTPDEWSDAKVAVRVKVKPMTQKESTETFTIGIENLSNEGATLCLSWDKTMVCVPFTVPTDSKVMANIQKVMSGPSANDYNGAANYFLTAKKDLNKALEWSTIACEMRSDAYWMLRTKSLIQAELKDKTGAIESAKKGMELAEKAGNKDYVTMFSNSIKEWSK